MFLTPTRYDKQPCPIYESVSPTPQPPPPTPPIQGLNIAWQTSTGAGHKL